MLTNSEAWSKVTLANIVSLEMIDEQMLRSILKAPRMTNHALLYLELGCLPVRYIIKSRRLNFLHYILNQKEESTLKSVLNAQMEKSSKSDWTEQVKRDLKEVEINLRLEDVFLKKSRNWLKHKLKKQHPDILNLI